MHVLYLRIECLLVYYCIRFKFASAFYFSHTQITICTKASVIICKESSFGVFALYNISPPYKFGFSDVAYYVHRQSIFDCIEFGLI